jgi:acyl-CoA synthetase (AMP-forming)/AMP-acid ligase II
MDTVLLLGGAGPALIDPDTPSTLTHDELASTVETLAGKLVATGVQRGDGVGIVLEQGPEAVLAFLAVLRAGAIAMPQNPALHAREMAIAFEDLPPRLVLEAGTLESLPAGPVPALPEPDDVALLLHTSGTTSRPKAVPLRHRQLAASARSIAAGYSLGPDDVSYCLMPLFHVHGLVASTLAALLSGGAVAVPRRMRPSALWPHLTAYGGTWFSAVPTILARLPQRPDGDVRLRFARSCSSSLPPTLWSELEERFGVPLVEAYGMTEAAHQMASNPLPPGERRPGTVGLPAGAEITILDGEVVIRGPGVIDGYLANPAADAEAFRDGWFRTGDLGSLSGDGYLTLQGRIKELINRGGEKIAPREIDEALLSHPAVREAAAFGVPDRKYGEVVHAVVVADESEAILRAHCGERLAAFKVPARIHVASEIPKGPTGKVQRRTLAEALGA